MKRVADLWPRIVGFDNLLLAYRKARRGKRYRDEVARFDLALERIDVSRYFPSIDHAILKAKLRRRIKDGDVLWLFDRIIDGAPAPRTPAPSFAGDDLVDLMQHRCGLPIGNLTSQFLGNLYLDNLDHHLKEVCGVRAYLRYVDDLALLDDDKRRLWDLRREIGAYMARERLLLHPLKQQVRRTRDGVDLLGYRVFPTRIRLRRDNGYRFRRRLRAKASAYAAGRIELSHVRASVAAWIGHAGQAQSMGLRTAVLGSVCFKRETGRTMRPACAARRRLEQQTEEPPLRQPQQEHRG